jgi:hypothetical protein
MKEKILILLSLCMDAKDKGHDVFFEYLPHVRGIRISSFENGWEYKSEDNPPTMSFGFYIDDKEAMHKADTAIEYLQELVGNVG